MFYFNSINAVAFDIWSFACKVRFIVVIFAKMSTCADIAMFCEGVISIVVGFAVALTIRWFTRWMSCAVVISYKKKVSSTLLL
jgi:hypothetical protein